MRILARLGLIFSAALVPVMVAAAAPQNVGGITATNEGGKVRVTWIQVADPTIAQYRIFYSHSSILGNSGLYDDFESVDGSVNSHLLQNIPPAQEIFVSVLAVNAAGEESPFFVQEASVRLSGTTTSSVAASAASSAATVSRASSAMSVMQASSIAASSAASVQTSQQGVLRLLSAEAVSATGVLLKFSHTVNIPAAQAVQAIVIKNASGATLQLKRFVMQGQNVVVHTETQTRGMVYSLTLGSVVTGSAQGLVIQLDPQQGATLFSGHPTGKAPVSGGTVVPTPGIHSDIVNLRLAAQAETGGAYTVDATWQAPAGTAPIGYLIAQTTDGGRTYGEARPVGPQALSLKIPGVPSGTFGVQVKALYADGIASRGISQVINLPKSGGTTGSVTNPNPGALPSSGPELWLAIAGTGSLIGAWKMKKQKEVKA